VPHQSWRLLESRPVSDHRIFRLRHDRYRVEPAGLERDFVVVDSPDWVNVIPLTADGQVVLIRQYRHGVQRVTLEVPGGIVDPHESPETAAVRELQEETGYAPARVRLLGRVHPNPAFQNNSSYMYLAEDCRQIAEPQPEPFERIEVVLHPLASIPELIRTEEITHSLVINAFAFLGVLGSGYPPR